MVIGAFASWFAPRVHSVASFSDAVAGLALGCTGKVLWGGESLGSAVLFGIDRVIVPLHVISGCCSSEIEIQFSLPERCQSVVFQVDGIALVDQELDIAVLVIKSDQNGDLPGNLLPIPNLSLRGAIGPCVVSSFVGGFPELSRGEGGPCSEAHFCSDVLTQKGASGGGYFDEEGNLFAIHLARSSGACSAFDPETRKALFLELIVAKHRSLFEWPMCQRLPSPNLPPCAPNFEGSDPCFDLEGKKFYHAVIQGEKAPYPIWEWKPSNRSGAGPRGLTIEFRKGTKLTYKFSPNCHGTAYNKHQTDLYNEAGRKCVTEYEKLEVMPVSFSFECYGVQFLAELL